MNFPVPRFSSLHRHGFLDACIRQLGDDYHDYTTGCILISCCHDALFAPFVAFLDTAKAPGDKLVPEVLLVLKLTPTTTRDALIFNATSRVEN